jgi:tRNA-uridine 2-sulfurtransferase
MKNKNQITALALFSGGLDSILATKLIQKQGIKVIPICFESPFFGSAKAKNIAKKIGIKLKVIQLKDDYLEIVRNPKFGYGKNLNPCIDCHSFMFQKLGSMLKELKADFLISGEVLGQRPKSQNKIALATVAKNCGYKDLIIRPLSQKLLPDTKPLLEGWVDKTLLEEIQGRNRARQLELLEEFGIIEYPSPAGGCLLTEKRICSRLQDLMDHKMDSYDFVELLRHGRHFRLNKNTKLILGRQKKDNEYLQKLTTKNMIRLHASDFL